MHLIWFIHRAKGHYTEGAEMIDNVMDIIRKNTEKCNQLQGFQICHSIAAGTGGGLGSLLLIKLKDDYPANTTQSFTVYPSPKVSDVVVEHIMLF